LAKPARDCFGELIRVENGVLKRRVTFLAKRKGVRALTTLPILRRVRAAWGSDPRCDAALRHSLVQSLYESPATILIGVLCGLGVAGLIAWTTAQLSFTLLAAAMALTGICRVINVYAFAKAGHHERGWQPDRSLEMWVRAYVVGGCSYSLLLGMLVYMTLLHQPMRLLDLPAAILAVGYCAATSSRSAARPEIPNVQMVLVALPFIAALLVRGSVPDIALAAILVPMTAGVMSVTRLLHRQYVDALIGERDNARLAVTFERQSRTDQLTGLFSRCACEDRLTDMMAAHQRSGQSLALLWLDLDRFKEINESLGHITGDELLCAVARRLLGALPSDAVVSRFGADEFVVIIPEADVDRAIAVSEGLRAAIAAPFTLAQHRLPVTMAIGIAVSPQDGEGSALLLQHAALALHQAKDRHLGCVRFAPAMKATLERARLIEQRLRGALSTQTLALAYQPLVDLATGRFTGCEALLRWQDSVLGEVSPAEFIPVAEATGMIEPMTRWVLMQATQDCRDWPKDLRVAVNVSPQLFRSGILSDAVMAALLESGLAAGRLEIEVTESLFLERDAQLDSLLLALRRAGVRLALDDFGTGYSSLAYLSRFRFDKIKLDKSFIRSAGRLREERAVAAAVTLLARELEMETVAEGIETVEQQRFATAIGIDQGQGFGLAKPQQMAALRDMLDRGAHVALLTDAVAGGTPRFTRRRA
jgi:diguanylate cyclase (GGDEF)-like protein